jgi:hypothetical protein
MSKSPLRAEWIQKVLSIGNAAPPQCVERIIPVPDFAHAQWQAAPDSLSHRFSSGEQRANIISI